MSQNSGDDYIHYRIEKAHESYLSAQILADNRLWSGCSNRLYYACFYVVSALLYKNKIVSKTHNGTKSQFSRHFISTGIVSRELGELYTELLDMRQEGDYGDTFEINEDEIRTLIPEVGTFLQSIEDLLYQNKEG